MPREIIASEKRPVNAAKLGEELHALELAGVRDYTVITDDGKPGVYVWDDGAPFGHYEHLDLAKAAAEQVAAVIEAHDPTPPPAEENPSENPREQLSQEVESATTIAALRAAILKALDSGAL